MKLTFLTLIAAFIFMLTFGFQNAKAQGVKNVPAKDASLIAYLLKEANQPDGHSADDVYLLVTIGKVDYVVTLATGKIFSRKTAKNASGGYYGVYAEASVNLAKKDPADSSQGGGELLKLTGTTWKLIARNETDYQCSEVKTVPKVALKALKVDCF